MKSEAKRICSELRVLSKSGINISREVVMMVASKNSYWYIVFANTNDFNDSMNELLAEAA